MVNWGLLFVGPLFVYAIGVLVWLYLSFWQLHRVMVDGQKERLREAAGGTTDFGIRDVRAAPVWPVNASLLVSMLSVDAMPLLTLFSLL